jgi:hypothetical protein
MLRRRNRCAQVRKDMGISKTYSQYINIALFRCKELTVRLGGPRKDELSSCSKVKAQMKQGASEISS